jgi:hypothetical protein
VSNARLADRELRYGSYGIETVAKKSEDFVSMPWSGWIVLIALFASSNSIGSFLMIIVCSPVLSSFSYVPLESLAATVRMANATGVKPVYVWPAVTVFSAGVLCLILALRKPKSPLYKHAAILLLGFLLAGAISIHRLSGWAGL